MTIIGRGQLRHRFWGDYSAVIGLKFDTADLAEKARVLALDAFTPMEADRSILRFEGGGASLKHAEAQLKAAGADMKKVRSLARSIDYGEPFTVTIRTEATDDGSEQLPLL